MSGGLIGLLGSLADGGDAANPSPLTQWSNAFDSPEEQMQRMKLQQQMQYTKIAQDPKMSQSDKISALAQFSPEYANQYVTTLKNAQAMNQSAVTEDSPMPQGTAPAGQPAPAQRYTYLKKGQAPFTDGIKDAGFQWAHDNQTGQTVQVPIPGSNNEKAKTQFLAKLDNVQRNMDNLNKSGWMVNENDSALHNWGSAIANSEGSFWGLGPGGQNFNRASGTKEQTMRDKISKDVSALLPLYMQAQGITPGMERAVGAQEMMMKALPSLGRSYQANQENIASLRALVPGGGNSSPQPQPSQQPAAPTDLSHLSEAQLKAIAGVQ
jgi:hypothetical protein